MVARDESEVIAVTAGGPALAEAARAAWDDGAAILPISAAATPAERRDLVDRLRPTVVDGVRNPHGVPAPGGTAAVVVTSGTAGAPKGVELTRAGMEVMGRGYSAGLDAGPADRWLACLPLHHVASLAVIARAHVTGVPYTVHDGFDLVRVARSPEAERTTIVSLVPTALQRLLDANAPLGKFRRVITGGAPCPASLRARAEASGVWVIDAYGLSETWGGFALDGRLIEGATARLAEVTGEIVVRGPMVMRGYRLDPERTREMLDADGWFHTGDVGTFDDDGRLRVIDRVKDVIITGGVNVSPTEVEGVLAHHPSFADVCVVGVPDEEWGERVVAFVVCANGEDLPTLEEVRTFAREHLSAVKLPRELRVTDAIPRTASGKPLRRLLRTSQTRD